MRFRRKLEKLEQEAELQRRAEELGLSESAASMERERPVADGLSAIGGAVGRAFGGAATATERAAAAAGRGTRDVVVPVVLAAAAAAGLYLLVR